MASISVAIVIFRKHNWNFVPFFRESLLPISMQFSVRILLFKRNNTRVSLWPQAATNIHVNGHSFQRQKSTVQCGKSSKQLSRVCRTEPGLGGHQQEQLANLYIHASIAYTANRHCWKTTSWTEILEDTYWSGKRKESKGELKHALETICQTVRRESVEQIESEDLLGKNENLRFSWEFYDRPARLHFSKKINYLWSMGHHGKLTAQIPVAEQAFPAVVS